MRRFAFAMTLLFVAVFPTAARAETSVTGELGAGNIDVSGHHQTANKPKPRIFKATALSRYVYVDPYAGLSCYEIWLKFYDKTCDYAADGTCTENFVPVAGPQIDLCAPIGDVNAAAAARTRAAARQYALDYFKSVPLPEPVPVMSAQEGITGATHQLNNQIDNEADFTDPDTAFGALILYCYATFDVDWGDGTHNTYSDGGATYPNSSIKHSYAKRGTYVVNVTVRWSADWTFGNTSGTLTGLQTQSALPAFPVGDLQAVLIS